MLRFLCFIGLIVVIYSYEENQDSPYTYYTTHDLGSQSNEHRDAEYIFTSYTKTPLRFAPEKMEWDDVKEKDSKSDFLGIKPEIEVQPINHIKKEPEVLYAFSLFKKIKPEHIIHEKPVELKNNFERPINSKSSELKEPFIEGNVGPEEGKRDFSTFEKSAESIPAEHRIVNIESPLFPNLNEQLLLHKSAFTKFDPQFHNKESHFSNMEIVNSGLENNEYNFINFNKPEYHFSSHSPMFHYPEQGFYKPELQQTVPSLNKPVFQPPGEGFDRPGYKEQIFTRPGNLFIDSHLYVEKPVLNENPRDKFEIKPEQPIIFPVENLKIFEKRADIEELIPLEENEKPLEETNKPLEENEKPLEENKKPLEEIKKPLEENEKLLEENKKPLEEIKKPFELPLTHEVVPLVVPTSCMQCMCDSISHCDVAKNKCSNGLCGLFKITWEYWFDAGQPTIFGENSESLNAYEHCTTDPECSARAVQNYMTRYYQDCNGDGRIDCLDFAAIHMHGGYSCNQHLPEHFERPFYECIKRGRSF